MIIEIINKTTIDFSTQIKIIRRNDIKDGLIGKLLKKIIIRQILFLLMNFASLIKHLVYDINKFEKDISGNRCT